MANPFVHIELNSTDVEKSKAFYGKLFDWELEDVPMSDQTYTMIKVGKGTGGGMMKQMIPGAGASWLAYVEVDDIRVSNRQGKIPGREGHEGRDRRDGHALAEHPHRSDRRDVRLVASEEVAPVYRFAGGPT
jgi:uncharacterized protein